MISLRGLGQWNGKPREFAVDLGGLAKNVTDIAVLVQSVGQRHHSGCSGATDSLNRRSPSMVADRRPVGLVNRSTIGEFAVDTGTEQSTALATVSLGLYGIAAH